MSTSASTRENRYTTDGVTDTFPYDYKILNEDDLVVLHMEAAGTNLQLLVKTTDYTVTAVGDDAGGNVILTSAALAALVNGPLYIYAKESLEQLTDLTQGDGASRNAHQATADKHTRETQQVSRFRNLAREPTLVASGETVGFQTLPVVVPASVVIITVAATATADAANLVTLTTALREVGSVFASGESVRGGTWQAQAAGDVFASWSPAYIRASSGSIEYQISQVNSSTGTASLVLSGWYD